LTFGPGLRHRLGHVAQAKEKQSPSSEAPFEEVLANLEGVVARLEGGELSLEASLAAFEEGVRLSRLGSARLDSAEERVEELLKDGRVASVTTSGEKEPVSR
jgi:exodeoxyribonuclease VII small subunit